MTAVEEFEHGEPRGVARHRRAGTPVCDECRDAYNEHLRVWRKTKQGEASKAAARRRALAQNRALRELARRYPQEFRVILADVTRQIREETADVAR